MNPSKVNPSINLGHMNKIKEKNMIEKSKLETKLNGKNISVKH